MKLSYIAILVVCLCSVKGHIRLNYSDVEKFGNSCPRLDSCAFQNSTGRNELVSIKERNCACDYGCSNYGDCCIDAPGDGMSRTVNNFKCFDLKQVGGVYMKDSCPPSYQGPDDIRNLCEEPEIADRKDPLGSMPVTDSLTGLTYKNYYCSICNNISDNIVLWTPSLECPLLPLFNASKTLTNDYIFQNLATDGYNWGIYLDGEDGALFFHDCEVDPIMPLHLENKIRFCKPSLVSDCSSTWEDDEIRTICRSYMGPKFVHGGNGYKNAHCAICNSINVTHLSCHEELTGMDIFRLFGIHSFALLLDINTNRGQTVGMVQMCEDGEVFDPFFKKCRSLTCLPGYLRLGMRCVPRISKSSTEIPTTRGPAILIHSNFSKNKRNVSNEHERLMAVSQSSTSYLRNLSGKSYNISEDSVGNFQNCLLISLVDEDYIMLSNESIFVPKYNTLYEPTNYHAANGTVLVCSHFIPGNETKFLPVMGHVTLIGLGLSMTFLMLHFLAAIIMRNFRHLPDKDLVSQCIALFCAYFCFIIGQLESISITSCTVIAFLTFYFFQVSFFWMGIISYDIWRILKNSSTELRLPGRNHRTRFSIYSCVAWITPLLLLFVLLLAEYTDSFSVAYRPGFAHPHCWFKSRNALLSFFAAPLTLIMLLNLILYISSARMIYMTTQDVTKQHSKSQRRDFKLYLRLALLMGLTWIVGLIASCVDIPFLWYIFIVSNSLQGLFIFIAFSFTKFLNYLQNKFKRTATPRVLESSGNTASSGSTHNIKPVNVFVQP